MSTAICYRNTKTTIPGWVTNLHQEQEFGYAYETPTHFVHFFGKRRLYIISVGLTALEQKQGTLEDWVKTRFGAVEITPMKVAVGKTIDGIWRPSLIFQDDIQQGLSIDKFQERSAEQALKILVQKLDEILLYIEPSSHGLTSFGHKMRELLILAATEVENHWKALMAKAGIISPGPFSTNDYVKLCDKAHLKDFLIQLRRYQTVAPIKPFENWSSKNPTASLSWYQSYNKTKHDRDKHFDESTLQAAIDAVAANVVMHCVRFGPFQLLNERNQLSGIINETFDISMNDADRTGFYLPQLSIPKGTRNDLFVYDCYKNGHAQNWQVAPLTL